MPGTYNRFLRRLASFCLILISILSLVGPADVIGVSEPAEGRGIGVVSSALECLAVPGHSQMGDSQSGDDLLRPDPSCGAAGVVHLNWQGEIARARLVLRVAGAGAAHTILVNGRPATQVPVYPGTEPGIDEGYVYLRIPSEVVLPGNNLIELTDDGMPGDGWMATNVRIQVFGGRAGPGLVPVPLDPALVSTTRAAAADAAIMATRMVVRFTNFYDGSTQEAEIQVPDGYSSGTPTPLVVYAHARSGVMSEGIDILGGAANAKGWLLASPQMHGRWVVPPECYVYPNDCTYDDKILAGTTGPNSEPNPGAYAYASLESQYDLVGTVRYMIEHYDVKLDQIYLVGYSMGGQIAAVTGAKFPHLFAAALDNKGPTDADVWYDEQVAVYGTEGATTLRAMRKECHIGDDPKAPPDNPFCYEQRSGIEYARNWIHIPLSMTHSVDDTLVPVHHSRDLRDAINGYGPDHVVSLYQDTSVSPTCPPYYHCFEPEPSAVLNFLEPFVLVNEPARISVVSDQSKPYYWLNLVQSGGAHWSRVEAAAQPDQATVLVTAQDDQPLFLGFNLGTSPIPLDEVGGAILQPGLGFPATTYLVQGAGHNELRDYASGYLDVDLGSTGQSTFTISAVTMALSADPETVSDPQTETAVTVVAQDGLGNSVPDGTEVVLSTTQGAFPNGSSTYSVFTVDGRAAVTLTVGPGDTLAEVVATLQKVTTSVSVSVIHGPNANPVVAGLPDQVLDEDTSLDDTVDLWAYAADDETPDDGLNYTIDNAPPSEAGVTVDGNRYVDIQPAANWCGETDVTIRVSDPGGLWDMDTFHLMVNCVNDLPWIAPAVPDPSADQDQPIEIDLSAYENDVEDSGTALDWTVSGEDHCTVSGQGSDDDVLTLIPQAGFVGSDMVTLHLQDSQGAETTQLLVVTWNESPREVYSLDVRVSASADDAEERPSGYVSLTSSDLELVDDGGDQTVGMRFAGAEIPQGATIVSAYVQFWADEGDAESTSLLLEGQATDDALAFVSSAGNISSRLRTGARVAWFPAPWATVGEAGLDQRTPDITSVVQEIVSRPGWSAGNALVVIVTGSGKRVAESYNGMSSGAPLLHVEYMTGPVENRAPTVDAGPDQTVVMTDDVVLDGTVGDDGLPDPPGAVTVEWRQVSGPGTATFADASAMDTTALFSEAGEYVLRLEADDGALTAGDEVTITVQEGGATTVVEVRVSSSADDAEEQPSGYVGLTSSDLELVNDGGDQVVGMRFAGVEVPQGATIVSAYVQFQADETGSEATSLLIAGEAVDDATSFVSTSGDISSRPRTEASVAWSPAPWTMVGEAGSDQQTPDIAAVIQEIISRPGWSAGNTLAMIVTGSGKRVAESYNGSALGAPLLHVEYGLGPTPNRAPTVDAGQDETVFVTGDAALDGTVIDDGLPDPPGAVTTLWSQVSGPGTVTFGNTNAVDTTASFPGVGVYVLRLMADDSELTAGDEVTISVTEPPPNQAPVVNAGNDRTVTLPAAVQLDGAITDDGLPSPPGAVTIAWSHVSGPGTVTFANTGVVTTTAAFSTDGVYVLRLSADDTDLSASDDITVTVLAPVPTLAETWTRWETTLISSNDYGNSYVDVSVAVTYTGPSGQVVSSLGFWDGDKRFKIRSMFPVTGTWTWVTTCSDTSNEGLHLRGGSVTVEPYMGTNRLYQGGYLQAQEGSRYLTYADGAPFLWIGDTAWAAPLNATLADWQAYIDDRREKKFSVVHIDTCGRWGAREDLDTGLKIWTDMEGNEPFFAADLGRLNPAFWQGYEQKVQYANDQGLVVLVVGVMNPIRRGITTDDEAGALRFAQSFAARMRGNFVVFSPGFDDEELGTELADKVAEEIERVSDMHLTTVHPDPDSLEYVMQYYDKPYLDFVSVQTGRGATGDTASASLASQRAIQWPLALYSESSIRPLVNLEARYDGSFTQWQMPRLPRSCGYLSMLSGAKGYSYGSDGLWNWNPIGYSTYGLSYDTDRWTWQEGMQQASSTDMRYMSGFWDSVEWWRLVPQHALIRNQASDAEWERKMVFAATEAGDLGVAYLPDNARIELDMSAFSTTVLARWFDPSSGTYAGIAGKYNNVDVQGLDVPGEGDWLLVFTPTTNESPVVDAGPDRTVALGEGPLLDGMVNDDGLPKPPGAVTTTWSQVSGPGVVIFGDAGAVDTTVAFSETGEYVLRLTADDGELTASDQVTVTVTEPPPNQAPEVDAGPALTITLGQDAVLYGTVSDDGLPDPPGAVTVTWSQVSGPAIATLADASAVDTTASVPEIGEYVLRLTADDGELTASDEVIITVQAEPVNQPPTVDAGPDRTVVLPGEAMLDGTVSDDGLPGPPGMVMTTWSQVSGPGTASFVDANAVDTAVSFSQVGEYVLRLEADDGELSASDEVAVIVQAGSATTVVEVRVSSSADDAEERPSGYVSLTSSDLELVDDGGDQTVGMRFAGVEIPQGATIVSAYVQFRADEGDAESTSLLLEGQATDDALAFVSSAGNISSRLRTGARVAWFPAPWATVGEAGPDQRTPDITSVVQEIVSRPGWSAGNALVVIVTGSGKRVAESYNGMSSGAPLLHVEYTVGPLVNRAPVVDAGDNQTVVVTDDAALDGTVSDDGLPGPPGAVTVEWSQVSGPGTTTFADASAVDTTATFSEAGVYTLRLTADDGELTGSDQTVVYVQPVPVNQAPSVDAGLEQTVVLPGEAVLDGTVTDDGLPDPPGAVTIEWSQVNGPGTVIFADAGAEDTTASFSEAGEYVLRLTANDGALTVSDEVTITVQEAGQTVIFEVRVSTSSDDAEEFPGGYVHRTSTHLDLIYDDKVQTVGMRFDGVEIPQGATIVSAYVQFQVDKTSSEATSLVIEGEAADDALTFTSVSKNISVRPRTGASVVWVPVPWTTVGEAGPDQQTPGLAPVIQEIVSRPGWTTGNALALIISGSGRRVAEPYDGLSSAAPLLHVEYSSSN